MFIFNELIDKDENTCLSNYYYQIINQKHHDPKAAAYS